MGCVSKLFLGERDPGYRVDVNVETVEIYVAERFVELQRCKKPGIVGIDGWAARGPCESFDDGFYGGGLDVEGRVQRVVEAVNSIEPDPCAVGWVPNSYF